MSNKLPSATAVRRPLPGEILCLEDNGVTEQPHAAKVNRHPAWGVNCVLVFNAKDKRTPHQERVMTEKDFLAARFAQHKTSRTVSSVGRLAKLREGETVKPRVNKVGVLTQSRRPRLAHPRPDRR